MTVDFKVSMSDGAQLYSKLLGADDPSKPLLIALHGAPGYSTHLDSELAFSFLETKFRVLVFDARGSGRSSLQPPYTHAQWVSDIEELRIWAKADKIVLAGGSYGGAVALEYALTHPNRLHALVLVGTFAQGVPLMMNALKSALTTKSVRVNVDPERQLRVWKGTLRDDWDFRIGLREIRGLFDKPGVDVGDSEESEQGGEVQGVHAETQNAAFGKNLPRYDVLEKLHTIHVPTLVTVGRFDVVAPVRLSKDISEGIPGAKLVVFEESGHIVSADEPERFQAVVGAFLTGLE